MLSRIAESLFWIGRYVERAEDTARILDVQTQLILEDPGVDEDVDLPQPALDHGGRVRRGRADRHRRGDAGARLRHRPPPASIAATLAAARESARRARETLSTSMWEAMNTTYRAIPSGHFRSMRPPVAFRWVRDRAAQINGIAEATMTRDEGYQFLVLGRSIERADMTSRLVATAALTSGVGLGHLAARVRRLRGVPAHLQGPRDRARCRGVPAARPAVPAVGGLRPEPGRAAAWNG